MKIKLSSHFTYRTLLRFTLPSMIMMVFTSIYGVVDGFFVSNYVGKTPFAAVNLIMPFLMLLGTIGFMFGTGGSALVAKTMGMGDREKAKRTFSLIIYSSIAIGLVLTILGFVFIRPIASLLGADGELLENCVLYGRIIIPALIFFILQNEFQSFFVTAERPQLGLVVIILAGVTNMVLDALFVAVFRWGLVGAAVATAISQFIGGVIPLTYFIAPNKSLLRLTKTNFDGGAILKASSNGASEMMSNLSMSLVNMLYNFQLMRFAGESGVAAYGVIMYVNFVFTSIFFGYTIGCAPIVSFHYGAENHSELKNVSKKSLWIIGIFSAAMFILAEVLAIPLSKLFVGYDPELLAITLRGFKLFSLLFLFTGLSIYGSAFFTALNNGLISATISFLRALIFQVASVLILPIFLKLDGVWLSGVLSELLAFIITIVFLAANKNRYHY